MATNGTRCTTIGLKFCPGRKTVAKAQVGSGSAAQPAQFPCCCPTFVKYSAKLMLFGWRRQREPCVCTPVDGRLPNFLVKMSDKSQPGQRRSCWQQPQEDSCGTLRRANGNTFAPSTTLAGSGPRATCAV